VDVEGVVEVEDGYLIAVGVGTVNVVATQDGVSMSGKANYLAANPVEYAVTVVYKDVNTSLNQVETSATMARKVVRNGQLYIIRGEHTYTALGEVIR
jgi:hypothetical protein